MLFEIASRSEQYLVLPTMIEYLKQQIYRKKFNQNSIDNINTPMMLMKDGNITYLEINTYNDVN